MIEETHPSIVDNCTSQNQLIVLKQVLKFDVNIICQKPLANSLKEAKNYFIKLQNWV